MKAARFFAYYSIASVLVGAIALVVFYPWHPRTWVGAIVWVLAAIPIWGALESLAGALIRDRIGNWIDPDRARVSGARIAYALVAMIALLAVISLAVLAVGETADTFIERHFSTQW
jgi:hypothetical protein